MDANKPSRKRDDPEYMREKRRRFMAAHPEKNAEYARAYREKHRETWQKANRSRGLRLRRKWRAALLSALGGACVQCGFDQAPALQVDHTNGDGKEERARGKEYGRWVREVVQSFEAGEGKYQLLCANCHCIKHYSEET